MWNESTPNGTTLRWVALDGRLLSVWRIEEPRTQPTLHHERRPRRSPRRRARHTPAMLPHAEAHP